MTANTAELLELSNVIGAAAAAVGSGAVIAAATASAPNPNARFDASAPAANDPNYEGASVVNLRSTFSDAVAGKVESEPTPDAAPTVAAETPQF